MSCCFVHPRLPEPWYLGDGDPDSLLAKCEDRWEEEGWSRQYPNEFKQGVLREYHNYEQWLRESNSPLVPPEYSSARCQVYDVLCEADRMLRSLPLERTARDVVRLAEIIQGRINLLESRRRGEDSCPEE